MAFYPVKYAHGLSRALLVEQCQSIDFIQYHRGRGLMLV